MRPRIGKAALARLLANLTRCSVPLPEVRLRASLLQPVREEEDDVEDVDWNSFPRDVFGLVLAHLSAADINACALVSRAWHQRVNRALAHRLEGARVRRQAAVDALVLANTSGYATRVGGFQRSWGFVIGIGAVIGALVCITVCTCVRVCAAWR